MKNFEVKMMRKGASAVAYSSSEASMGKRGTEAESVPPTIEVVMEIVPTQQKRASKPSRPVVRPWKPAANPPLPLRGTS